MASLAPKRAFRRGAANRCFEPFVTDAAAQVERPLYALKACHVLPQFNCASLRANGHRNTKTDWPLDPKYWQQPYHGLGIARQLQGSFKTQKNIP
jgi:hypothetical protein